MSVVTSAVFEQHSYLVSAIMLASGCIETWCNER
jgi:hypothetical protein